MLEWAKALTNTSEFFAEKTFSTPETTASPWDTGGTFLRQVLP